jgi:NADPH:quinone reductase-like Zn-dependent oxidoreductase
MVSTRTRTAAAALAALLAICWGTDVTAQTTQKQWQLAKTAQGMELKLVDAPVRQPGANEILIRMRAASLNRRDVAVTKGQYPIRPGDNLVPLSDGAGEVAAVGSGVSRVKVGDRVAPIFFQSWISGRPAGNVGESSLGGGVDGVLSQYVTLSAEGVVKIPDHLSFEEAATLPCAAVTAWNGLVTRGRMQKGDHVLLEGTGGVSVFGLQFTIAAGAKPIMTSSSDDKLARAKSLGAIGTVNYKTTPDWEKPVLQITGPAGVQHVLEVGGKDSLQHALAALGPGGHIALIGGLGGFGGDIPAVALMLSNRTASGIYVGSRADFEAMNAFIAQHRIKPIVDKVVGFADAKSAYELMENGNFFGKIVIRM